MCMRQYSASTDNNGETDASSDNYNTSAAADIAFNKLAYREVNDAPNNLQLRPGDRMRVKGG